MSEFAVLMQLNPSDRAEEVAKQLARRHSDGVLPGTAAKVLGDLYSDASQGQIKTLQIRLVQEGWIVSDGARGPAGAIWSLTPEGAERRQASCGGGRPACSDCGANSAQ